MYKNDLTITLHVTLSLSLSLPLSLSLSREKWIILILLPGTLQATIPAHRKPLSRDFSQGKRACCVVSLAGPDWVWLTGVGGDQTRTEDSAGQLWELRDRRGHTTPLHSTTGWKSTAASQAVLGILLLIKHSLPACLGFKVCLTFDILKRGKNLHRSHTLKAFNIEFRVVLLTLIDLWN